PGPGRRAPLVAPPPFPERDAPAWDPTLPLRPATRAPQRPAEFRATAARRTAVAMREPAQPERRHRSRSTCPRPDGHRRRPPALLPAPRRRPPRRRARPRELRRRACPFEGLLRSRATP